MTNRYAVGFTLMMMVAWFASLLGLSHNTKVRRKHKDN